MKTLFLATTLSKANQFPKQIRSLLKIAFHSPAGGFVSLVTRKDPSFIIDLIIAGAILLLITFVVLLIILITRNLRLLKQLRDV